MKAYLNKSNEDIDYPCLMKDKKHIVLFTEESIGTCVWCTEAVWEDDMGLYSEDWFMCDFFPFNGSITLSND